MLAVQNTSPTVDAARSTSPAVDTTRFHSPAVDTARFARVIEASKRARWEIERDVIRGRSFSLDQKFLPDGLSRVHEVEWLTKSERRFLSQVQGRTYANLFGVCERFINAKVLELTRDHWLGDQVALESLIRFSDEELKHQELFLRIEQMVGESMPAGYKSVADPDEVALAVLSKSTWAVLALTCHIELFTLQHFRESIEPDAELSPLYKDIFLFHWKEESQHAVIDELEWRRIDAGLGAEERDRGVDDLIALVGAVDGILQAQSAADAAYFAQHCGRKLDRAQLDAIANKVLAAYRWQYIGYGVGGRFKDVLFELIDEAQAKRVTDALATIL
jgi:hypothetical protein